MSSALALRPTLDSGTEALAPQTALVVADGSCSKIRELLAEALVPVLWLSSDQDPVEVVTAALAERRQQGQPVQTLHWVSHGRPGELLVGNNPINKQALVAHARQLAQWGINSTALWSCEVGSDPAFTGLWEELTGDS